MFNRQVLCRLLLLCSVSPTAFGSDLAMQPQPRDDGWLRRHEDINQEAQARKWNVVFIGDSITAGWKSQAGAAVWDKYFGNRHAGNLGIGGDQTQHVLYRLANGNLAGQTPKLAVIMIGTNNLGRNRFQPPETIAGIAAVVQAVRTSSPDTKILLLGVFPRGAASNDPHRAKIDEVNHALSALADWEDVHFLDIGHVFLEADGSLSKHVMHDFLHLTTEGYARWAEAIEPKVAELLDESDAQRHVLFDGTSLDGWADDKGNTPPKGWGVIDGTLAVTGWGDDALTTQQFGDFDFQAEWRMPRKGNGGIFYRVADYRYIWLGPEYQLCDDLTRGYRLDSDGSTGACIDLYGPVASKPIREHSEWNQSRIVVIGNHVEHWLNGQRILQYDLLTDEWHAEVKESKFSRLHPHFGQPERGKFKLQNHLGSRVKYRDIFVREL